MATREDILINKETLLCSVCLEPFTLPRTLPCLHSFCHLCLEEYIKVSVKSVNGVRGFDCPVCRAFTPTPVQGLPEQEWTARFPQNFTLLSILDSSKIVGAEMEQAKVLCDSCHREDIAVVATSYCSECEENMCTDCQRYHRKSKFTSKHVSRNIEDSGERVKALDFIRNLKKCSKHPLEKIKYICEDHDESCCNECTTLIHRKCEHVVSLAEKATSCSKDNTAMTDTMNELESHTELLLDVERKQLTCLDEARDKTKASLTKVKEKMLETFEQLSRRTLDKMEREHKDISANTLDNISSIEALRHKIKLSGEKNDGVKQHGNEGHVYLYAAQLKKDIKQFSEDLRSLQKSLKCDTVVVNVTEDLTEMLNWVSVRRQTSESQVPQPPAYRPDRERDTKLKHETSTELSYIRSCVWKDDSRLFLCDYHASQIAAYDVTTSGIEYVSTFNCTSNPGSIVKLDASQMAVSYPGSKTVLIMDMNPATPTVVREIKTQNPPWGLAYNSTDNHLLVQSRDGTIRYMRLDGTDVGSLPLPSTVKQAVQNTCQIAFDSNIKVCYLACYNLHKVMAIDVQGQIVFDYSHKSLQRPFGISLGPDGDIYVGFQTGNSILQLSPSGQLLRELLTAYDGVVGPWTICFNDRMDQFVVACCGYKTIRVYDFV